jgi:hypothetical protein
MKKILISLLSTFAILCCSGQEMNNIQLYHMQKPEIRREISVPDIKGYITLKCDFHMHTVFSDGVVWPTVRVDEAWQEGLDAIAITDHIEKQPSRKFIGGDHNASYEMAKDYAKEKNIILIHGGEITRKMPPGHLNAIFINDANQLDTPDPVEALMIAKKQGAFIMWNHPGWKAQQPDTCLWMPMHQSLFEKGLINGIEVFNEIEFYPIVLDWCLNKNISVIANSDIHGITSHLYDLNKGYRPMTLVFSKGKTLESIREAMFDKRTVAWFDNKLAGREDLLKAIFEASVKITPVSGTSNKKEESFEIRNISAIPFVIESNTGSIMVIHAEGLIRVQLARSDYNEAKVINLLTGSGSCLRISIPY